MTLQLVIGNKNYSSWSMRPWVLMRMLEIPFAEQVKPLIEGGCWDEYREFSPNGRVPCLHDAGRVVWESLAITEYLAEDYPAVWPLDRRARVQSPQKGALTDEMMPISPLPSVYP